MRVKHELVENPQSGRHTLALLRRANNHGRSKIFGEAFKAF